MARPATKKKSKTGKSKISSRSRAKLPKRKAAKKKATKKTATKKKVAKKIKKVAKKASTRKIAQKRPAIQTIPQVETALVARLSEGEMAPDFTMNNQAGQAVRLSDFRGKNVVLYFYPKDDTPGCTKEACSFRDHIGSIDSSNAVVLGVSFDDQESHQKFIEKYGLNFQLLTDADKEVANAYGVYVEKNMYGNKSMGIERSTFVIDKEGIVRKAIRRVSVDGHTEEVLEVLKNLQ